MKKFIELEYAERIQAKSKQSITRGSYHHYTMELITNGSGYLKIKHKEYSLTKGDVYILWKGEAHSYGPDRKDPWGKAFINFDGELADYLCKSFQLKSFHKFPKFSKPHLFDNIIKLYEQASPNKNEEFAVYLMELFIELKKYNNPADSKRRSTIVIDMIQFIEQHIDKPVSIEQIANYVHKSVPQMIRLFKKEMNTTPYQYLLQKRINLSKYLLKENMLSIKEIAYRLQFADEFYFSNFFKSKEGISPKKYKEKENLQTTKEG